MGGFRRRERDLPMSSEEIVLSVKNITKHYEVYEKPSDRLKQFIFPKITRLFGGPTKKYYREFSALNNVSFDVKKGETIGIIGRNGSGKSTLLQIICGTLASTSGNVKAKGRIAALLELGSGFNSEFTGRENVRLNAMIMGLSAKQIDEKMSEILNFADIGIFIDQNIKTYSSGMLMRLAFAVQAHIEPEILIIDEALAVGDVFFIHKCMARFHELKKSGVTIILVSHDSTAIKMLCDKAIWLKNGELKDFDRASSVVNSYMEETALMFEVPKVAHSELKSRVNGEGMRVLSAPDPTARKGNQKLIISGADLFKRGDKADYVESSEDISILLNIENIDFAEGENIILGYILKNIRGIDIASNNNVMERFEIKSPKRKQALSIQIDLSLPLLHAGSYTFSIGLSHKDEAGEILYLDYCENLIRFHFDPQVECHVLMTLKSKYTVLKADDIFQKKDG